jgi:predicted DNA-binding protein (MmcQ/YjbR family)
MRTRDELHDFCMSMKGATEDFPFADDVSVYKVMNKMFALLPMDVDPPTISLKCDPNEAIMLRQMYEAVTGGYHLNKKHWNTVTVDGEIPDQQIREMIADSYDLVVQKLTKKQRAELEQID